jgi:hypothetical protein
MELQEFYNKVEIWNSEPQHTKKKSALKMMRI